MRREQSCCRDGLYLDATEVNRRSVEDSKWLLVDVRRPEEYVETHIPGSINVASSAIKRRSFLLGKKIVLVGRGHTDSALQGLRNRLIEGGFTQVFILDGGLNAWRLQVGPLSGDALAQRRLNRITAQQFFSEEDDAAWAMIDISGWESSGDHSALALRRFLSAGGDEGSAGTRRILILGEDETGYAAMEKVVADLGWTNVFYLEGGKRAYEAYLEMQKAMLGRGPAPQSATMQCQSRRP